MKKNRFLLIGDYMEGTGFHRVVDHIKNAIRPHFDLYQVGVGYHGDVFEDSDGTLIYPETSDKGGQFGHKHISSLIDQLEPDMLFIVHDIVFIRFMLQALRHKKPSLLRGAYLALDGEIVKRRKMISPLKALDFCVFYTEYAYEQVQTLLHEQPSLLHKRLDFSIIPHGVDTSVFHPVDSDRMKNKMLARKVLFPKLKSPESTFIVLNANRPTARKRIDITLKAFAEFAKGKSSDEVKLYLHQSFTQGVFDTHTENLIEKLALRPYLLKGLLKDGKPIVSNSELNLLYNACDIGINTCMGEGWGLVSCEHAATAAAQILPKHTAFPEIWKDAAAWVKPEGLEEVGFSPHKMYSLNPSDFCNQLEVLYEDGERRSFLAQKAFETIKKEKYQWENIEKQWEELFLYYIKKAKGEQGVVPALLTAF